MRITLYKFFFAFVIGVCMQAGHAQAEERATKEEAIAFVKKAIAYAKEHGKEKALAEFNNPKGQFIDRELFIVALDLNGLMLANGGVPKLVGKSVINLRDVNGKYFVKDEIELAKTKGQGWVDFEWNNPVEQKMELRSVYLERIDDYIINTGVFRPK